MQWVSEDELWLRLRSQRLQSTNFRQSPNAFSRREVISAVKSTAVSNFGLEDLFPKACWNCNSAALGGLPKTNNAMEGWHKGFNARFRKAHMPLSQFIVQLKAEEEKTRQMVVRTNVNPAEVLRRPEYAKREANLKLLVQGYQPCLKMKFLKSIQYHLAKFPSVQRNEIDEETIVENPVEM